MSSTPAVKKKSLYQKRWFQLCGVILLLLPVLFMSGLYGVKSYLIDWFEQNGAESAAIEKLSVNPFLGRVTVTGLDVQVGGNSLLKNAEMVVDVGFTDLFKKNIKVQSALYSGLVLDFEQFEDGSLRIGSYTIENSAEEPAVDATEKVASSWAFLADHVDLANCLVKVKTPDLDLELLIEKAELRQFTTREGKAGATFLLEGTLNNDPIRIDLSSLQVLPSIDLKGDVKVSRFQLTEIAGFLKESLPVFSGDIGLDGNLEFSMGKQAEIQVNYSGEIEAKQPDIGSDVFATRADNLKWKGTVHYESAEAKPMIITTDGLLAAKEYAVEVPGAEFTNQESLIELEGKNRVTIVDNVLVEYEGRLLIEGSSVQLPANEITEEKLLWQGGVTYDSNKDNTGQYVGTKGELTLGALQFQTGEEGSKTSVGSAGLGWKGDLVYGQEAEGNGSYVQLAGNLDGKEIVTELGAMKIEQELIALTTDSKIHFGEYFDIVGKNSLVLDSFSFNAGEDGPQVSLEKLAIKDLEGLGKKDLRLEQLDSTGLSVLLPGSLPMDVTVPTIQLSGYATGDLVTHKLDSITLERPQIVATHNGEELLRLDRIEASQLQLGESQHVIVENLSLFDLTFLGVKEDAETIPFLTLGDANLAGISWEGEGGFTGKTLHFNNLVTTLIRDKEGALNVSERLAAMKVVGNQEEPKEEVEVAESENEQGIPIRLGEVAVTGESHVKFEDYTLAVPYITDLAISKMELLDLDSTKPETKSPFVLNAKLEERAPFDVTGDISPFMAPIALHLKLKLKNYPLSRLSAYTVQSVGTALASGQLKLKTKIDLSNDNLDMDNEIILKKLETKTIAPELAEELNNQLPIPLDAALSILRDSDRNISLDIPLKGPVSDLNVGISDVLITALSKAIVPAASGYLMYTLGPYGALAYVGMKVGEKMLKVSLPPVEYAPGDIEITAEHKKYLEKVAEILKGRPETDIQLCPQVVSWEYMDDKQIAAVEGKTIEVAEEEQEKLVEMGQQRAESLQAFMVSEYGVEESRLLICNTRIATEKKEKPLIFLNL